MKQNLEKVNIDIAVTLGYTKEKLFDDYKWVSDEMSINTLRVDKFHRIENVSLAYLQKITIVGHSAVHWIGRYRIG